jgi:hypothetical protein
MVFTQKHLAMLFKFENSDIETDTSFLQHATLWGPENEEENDDSNDDGRDDGGMGTIDDLAEDADDLHEIQAEDYLNEPDPGDDEHFPEEEE